MADEIDRILNDENWKRQLIDGEKVRLAFFSEQNVQGQLENIVKKIDSIAKKEKK